MRSAAAAVAMVAAAGVLASCGPRPQAQEEPAAPASAAPAAVEMLGIFEAVSNTAMGMTGDITVDETSLRFEQGHVYATEVIGPLQPGEPLDAQGADLSLTLGLGADQDVEAIEVRRIASAAGAAAASAAGGLCGETGATHVVLVISAPTEGQAQSLWLAAFAGEDAPGPSAKDAALCGAFLYMRDTAT